MRPLFPVMWVVALGLAGCGSETKGNNGSHAPDADAGHHSTTGDGGPEGGDGDAPDAGHDQDAGDGDDDAGMQANPVPDCTQTEDFCVAGSGTANGRAIRCVAMTTAQGIVNRVFSGSEARWSINCITDAGDVSMKVQFPVQKAGPVELQSAPGSMTGPYVEVDSPATGGMTAVMEQDSDNFKEAHLTGTVSDGGGTPLGSGTLTASWEDPKPGCVSGAPLDSPCAGGKIKMTFHVPLP